MGVESPKPGIPTFHLTCSVSLQCIGGSASGATPVARGPRHWGQERLASEVESLAWRADVSKSVVAANRKNDFICKMTIRVKE